MERLVSDISMEKVVGPMEPVRGSIDMEKVRELAESIREHGQLQDALVRPYDGKYEIVWGDRRYLALKLILAPTIRAEIRELTDEAVIVLRATENIQREDLTPMEQAKIYGQLYNRLHYSIEKIARELGKSPSTIRRYLNLLDIPEDFHEALDEGRLSVTVAEILSMIDDPEMRKYYLTNAVDHGCSAKTAQLWVSDYNATKAAQYYAPRSSEDGAPASFHTKPIYYACDLCSEPVDLSNAGHILACPACMDKLKSRI